LDTSKNIISSSSDMTQDTNPVQNVLCDQQSGAKGNADKKCKVKQAQEMKTDKSKPTRRLKKRSNPGGNEFTKQTASKKSKGGYDSTEQSKFKKPTIGQLKAVPGQGLICYKCGDGHRAADCSFNGDCHGCGKTGHKDRVCKENPNSIVRWMPAHAQDLATSSPGSVNVTSSASQLHPTCSPPSECSQQVTPGVPSPSPAPPMAPAPPQTGDGPSSVSAHSRVCAMPTAVVVGRGGVVQPTTSTPHPPMAVPAYQQSQGQAMICFKCGVIGHCAAECTYIGSCSRCGQLGHMERVCKENPDSIIKWEQVLAYALAVSSHGSVHMTAPTSQLHQAWKPPRGCFLPVTPAVPTLSLTPAAPAPPPMGVTASSTSAQPGVSATPAAVSLGKPDMVSQPTSSALRPPTALLAYRPVLGQYHQVATSQLLPAWAQPPGYFWQAPPIAPSPLLAPHVTPMPPQPGVAASPRPAHFGAYPMTFPFGRPW
jgi:hypothetical protein